MRGLLEVDIEFMVAYSSYPIGTFEVRGCEVQIGFCNEVIHVSGMDKRHVVVFGIFYSGIETMFGPAVFVIAQCSQFSFQFVITAIYSYQMSVGDMKYLERLGKTDRNGDGLDIETLYIPCLSGYFCQCFFWKVSSQNDA